MQCTKDAYNAIWSAVRRINDSLGMAPRSFEQILKANPELGAPPFSDDFESDIDEGCIVAFDRTASDLWPELRNECDVSLNLALNNETNRVLINLLEKISNGFNDFDDVVELAIENSQSNVYATESYGNLARRLSRLRYLIESEESAASCGDPHARIASEKIRHELYGRCKQSEEMVSIPNDHFTKRQAVEAFLMLSNEDATVEVVNQLAREWRDSKRWLGLVSGIRIPGKGSNLYYPCTVMSGILEKNQVISTDEISRFNSILRSGN